MPIINSVQKMTQPDDPRITKTIGPTNFSLTALIIEQ